MPPVLILHRRLGGYFSLGLTDDVQICMILGVDSLRPFITNSSNARITSAVSWGIATMQPFLSPATPPKQEGAKGILNSMLSARRAVGTVPSWDRVAIFMDLPGLTSPSFQPSRERDVSSGDFGLVASLLDSCAIDLPFSYTN